MKIMLQRFLGGIIIIAMAFSMSINYYLQIKVSQKDMDVSSKELFWQIKQILSQNQIELQQVTDDFTNKCLLQAKNAAYIVQCRPSILDDQKEMEKVAALLEVDEFHIFDTKGNLYAGSEPKYFGFTFESGEQMQFFLPMLKDKTLELCQEITPNTAEDKLMQYAAVWMEDGQGIVQVGLEPARVVEATKKNELSYIFSLLTADSGAVLYAVHPETYEILGSTDKNLVGKYITEMGLEPQDMLEQDKGSHVKIDGQSSYSIFTNLDSVIIGRSCSKDILYKNVNQDTILLGGYLVALSVVMILGISIYLDKKIIKGIDLVNSKLQNITDGNLDEQIGVSTTPEFTELSGHINIMIQSLLDSIPFPLSVTDNNRNWTFINKSVEDMLGVKRKDAVGKPCSKWGAAICNTDNCGLNCLNRGNKQTFFDQAGADFKVDVSYLLDEHKKQIGHVELVQDISSLKETQNAQTALVERIGEMCEDFVNASGNLMTVSQSLADGATDQASAVEELFALINETTDNVVLSEKDIQQASINVEEIGNEVKVTNEEMQTMVDAMAEIEESSKQIEMITKSIESIASQTNLLSLNASIEAARAGEAGKGFAVVASEIGELAKQSAGAAKNTSSLISNSMAVVENGTHLANKTKELLNSLTDKINSVVSTMENIADASQAQTGAMNQINEGVEQISNVIQSNSAVAQQTAATSNVLNDQTTHLNDLVVDFNKSNQEN